MYSLIHDVVKQEVTKVKVVKFLNDKNITFEFANCCGKEKICIDLDGSNESCQKLCCDSDIIVRTTNKDIIRLHPTEIIYIAIENRKSAIYVDEKRIETNLPLEYWKDTLNPKIFAQPHSSYLVNLCYVEEVTKEFVKMKCNGKEYSVYTSTRKVNDFKKAFLEYNK